MNRLTDNQRRAVNAAPRNARPNMIAGFIRQNANISTPRRNARSQPQTTRIVGRVNTSVPRNPYSGPQSGVTSLQGVAFFKDVQMTANANQISSTTIHPRHIPPVKHMTDQFQEWRYTSMAFRFVTTTASNHAGSIAWAIVANGNRTCQTQTQIMQVTGSHKQAVVTTGPWINVKPCPSGHWYQNIPLVANSPATDALRQPGWFSFVAVSTANANVGYIEVSYSLQFRHQRDAA